MNLYRAMRLVSIVSICFGLLAFLATSWVYLGTRNATIPNSTNSRSWCPNFKIETRSHQFVFAAYRHAELLRSCLVVVVVSLTQVISGLVLYLSPLQGSRDRSKKWFCLNACLNLVLFVAFAVPLMDLKRRPGMTDAVADDNECLRSMTSSLHHTVFFTSVSLDSIVHFLLLVYCLLILRYDDNRDYELVAII